MTEKTTVGGIPIECLTGEPAVIWSGWCILGDRELVREASAKGTHINLAHKCLAYRRHCSIEDAQLYFDKEVNIWIAELLEKHQVYRASHILKNVGKDPIKYIFDVCTKCKESSLRNYLSQYLVNVACFKDEHIESWDVLKSIAQFEERHKIQDGLSSSLCIDDVLQLPDNIKQAVCTELYFSLNEQCIKNNISNTILWDFLLSNNKLETLQLWIDIYYSNNMTDQSNDVTQEQKSLLSTLCITTDMIEYIDSSNASALVKDLTKNHLCKYGVFINKEQENIKLMLGRIFGSLLTMKEFYNILSYSTCNVDKSEFSRNIDNELCLAYCLHGSDIPEDKTKIANLFDVLTEMCKAEAHYEDALIRGIFETIHYITDDIRAFLMQNHLVVLMLIFLHLSKSENTTSNNENDVSKDSNKLRDIFETGTDLQIGPYNISAEILQNTLKQIPTLEHIVEKKVKQDEVTIYDLLDGYKNFNVKQAFKWRFKNEPMPNFSSESLVKKYGHTESLTYGYYLKEARPNMAIHSLKRAQSKILGNISSQRKSKAALYAHIFALKNLDKPEIICSCISFIEMLGVDSENLRLHVTAANYVQKEANVSIGHLLERVMYKNEHDLKSVMSYLESAFQKYFENANLSEDSQQFVEVLKMWDVIVRFAKAHNYPLPESFLRVLANQNLWFEFVLLCDIFAYPVNQVLDNVKQFEDPIIKEHLLTCLNNPQLKKSHTIVHDEQKLKSRDIRQSLYHRIGVKQSGSPSSVSPISSIDESTSDSYVSSSEYSFSGDNVHSPDDDIWLIILKCHQSPDPPGALINASRLTLRPILTILATCYEPSSTAAYCYSWMTISTADEDILSDYKDCLEHQIWPANKVFNLLDRMMLSGYINTLSRAYSIFMPDSPFNPLFMFLMQCVNHGDFKGCQQNLLDFKHRCLSLKCNKVLDWHCFDATYLNNSYWVAVVALRCIITTLAYCLPSTHLQTKFLEVLTRCNFQQDMPVQVPDFRCLLQITKILQKTKVTMNFAAFTLSDNLYNYETEIQRCIDDLTINENYNNALELSKVAGLNSYEIILAQYRKEFKQYVEKHEKVHGEFWNECAERFREYNLPGEKAAEFFIEHAEKVSSHKERYEILKFAFETLKDTETEQQTVDTLEMAMWKSCVLAGPENIQLDNTPCIFNRLKTELLSGLNKLEVTCTLADFYEKNATEILINKLIDSGKLDIALRISAIFNYSHKDLQILMLCLSLAEGEILPTDLTSEQKSIIAETSKSKQQIYGSFRNRGLQTLSSSSSLSTISSPSNTGETSRTKDENIYKTQIECISVLEKLFKSLDHGTKVCLRIVLCYKLAVRLGKSYQFILLLNNPIQFLQDVAESNVENKVEIVNDIITAFKISSDSTALFLAENIAANVTRGIEAEDEDCISMWGYSLDSSFHVIMDLCEDVSLLGWQLLKTTTRLLGHFHGEKKNVASLKTIVELLIRSHDCFTTSCNMEGIASVLRKCQNLANTLQNLKYWTLLVRLVTGVGRFTEMNYIFQILKEHDQFEFLLGKGLDKVIGLKTALLEFLRRYCPENKELFTLVALHFRLYHEIALTWENEAKDLIRNLITDATKECGKTQCTLQSDIKLTKTEIVQKKLQLAITNYTHATQYYLQDNKLNLAVRCSDQARLVALQLSLLSTVPNNLQVVCILNLKSDEIDKILCNDLNFSQALIMIHAYNHPVDWANLIYCHCVLNGEMKYLKEFIAVNKLTPALVQDCARRYRLEKSITHTMKDNMKTLISEISDIECKYMLASQLGFKSVVESMLNNPIIGAYLKDTVWKKGYNITT